MSKIMSKTKLENLSEAQRKGFKHIFQALSFYRYHTDGSIEKIHIGAVGLATLKALERRGLITLEIFYKDVPYDTPLEMFKRDVAACDLQEGERSKQVQYRYVGLTDEGWIFGVENAIALRI